MNGTRSLLACLLFSLKEIACRVLKVCKVLMLDELASTCNKKIVTYLHHLKDHLKAAENANFRK